MEATKVLWPFGAMDHLTPDSAATLAVEIENRLTVLEPSILAANMTLNVTVADGIEDGAELIVKIKTTATETTTFGTGIDAPVITGVAGKTKTQAFILVSGVFVAKGASVQID